MQQALWIRQSDCPELVLLRAPQCFPSVRRDEGDPGTRGTARQAPPVIGEIESASYVPDIGPVAHGGRINRAV